MAVTDSNQQAQHRPNANTAGEQRRPPKGEASSHRNNNSNRKGSHSNRNSDDKVIKNNKQETNRNNNGQATKNMSSNNNHQRRQHSNGENNNRSVRVRGELSDTAKDVMQLKSDVGKLRQENERVHEELSKVQQENCDLRSQVENMQHHLSQIQSQLSQFPNQPNDFQGQFSAPNVVADWGACTPAVQQGEWSGTAASHMETPGVSQTGWPCPIDEIPTHSIQNEAPVVYVEPAPMHMVQNEPSMVSVYPEPVQSHSVVENGVQPMQSGVWIDNSDMQQVQAHSVVENEMQQSGEWSCYSNNFPAVNSEDFPAVSTEVVSIGDSNNVPAVSTGDSINVPAASIGDINNIPEVSTDSAQPEATEKTVSPEKELEKQPEKEAEKHSEKEVETPPEKEDEKTEKTWAQRMKESSAKTKSQQSQKILNAPPAEPVVKHSLLLFAEGTSPGDWKPTRPWVVRGDLVARVLRAAVVRNIFKEFYIAFKDKIFRMPLDDKCMALKNFCEGDVLVFLQNRLRRVRLKEFPDVHLIWLNERGTQYLRQAKPNQGFSIPGGRPSYLFAVGGKEDPIVMNKELVDDLNDRYEYTFEVSLGRKSMLASEVILRLPVIPTICTEPPPEMVSQPTLYVVQNIPFPEDEHAFLASGLNALILYVTQCGHGRNKNVALLVKYKDDAHKPLFLHRPSLPSDASAPSGFALYGYFVHGKPSPEGNMANGIIADTRHSKEIKNATECLKKRTDLDFAEVIVPLTKLEEIWFLPDTL